MTRLIDQTLQSAEVDVRPIGAKYALEFHIAYSRVMKLEATLLTKASKTRRSCLDLNLIYTKNFFNTEKDIRNLKFLTRLR